MHRSLCPALNSGLKAGIDDICPKPRFGKSTETRNSGLIGGARWEPTCRAHRGEVISQMLQPLVIDGAGNRQRQIKIARQDTDDN